jgi:cysteine-rich repeat protein
MDATSMLDGTGRDDGSEKGDGASSGDGTSNGDAIATGDGSGGDGGPLCGNAHLDPGEACDDGNANRFDGCLPDCTRPTPIGPPARTWTYYRIPGTQCLDGSEAGFGVSTVPTSNNLMIYLEGGGACFNDGCDFTALSVPFVPPPDGIFNRTNSANPVRDWNMIYIPYCTGDIYGGDRDTTLAGSVRHFHGYRNIGRYLEAIVPAFPSVTRVLITGISAGGFGSGLNAGRIADAFAMSGPSRPYAHIDDSGPPFGNAVIPPCLQQIFRNVWGLDDTIIRECGADCPDPNNFASGVLHHLDRTHPTMDVGMFSNVGDTVIRTFMGAGWGNGTRNNCAGTPIAVPISVYSDGLLGLRSTYMTRSSFYFIGLVRPPDFGLGHTVLRSPSYYLTSIDGTSVPEWVGDVLAGRVTQVGP